jgi:molybdenum cofactor cytidylyltransferase
MITGILLAAGSGSRFGGGKLLHALPDGTPIGVASLRNLHAALPAVIAVVRSDDDALHALLEAQGITVCRCTDANQGMARSLVCGIEASRGADGWVIALGDMPYVAPGTIKTIAARIARTGAIAVPLFHGMRGHPVGFGRRYLEELLLLQGDEGARSVITRHADEVETIELDDPGISQDIDHRADLK